MLYIERTMCEGCATCADACPTGAIRLDGNNGVAVIDGALCNDCLACLDVCPTGAIQQTASSELVPAPAMGRKDVSREVIKEKVIPVSAVRSPAPTRHPGRWAALAGTALSFMGSRILPHVAEALVDSVERWLARGTSSRRAGRGKGGRGRRRRRRHDR